MRTNWTRSLGLLAGCALAVGFVASGTVPNSAAQAGASIEVRSGSFSELSVSPAGRLISVRNLVPGRRARTRLSLRNATDVALSVRPRLVFRREPPTGLRARVVVGGEEVFDGAVEELYGGGRREFTVRSRALRRLTLELSVAKPAASGMRTGSHEARFDLLTRVRPG